MSKLLSAFRQVGGGQVLRKVCNAVCQVAGRAHTLSALLLGFVNGPRFPLGLTAIGCFSPKLVPYGLARRHCRATMTAAMSEIGVPPFRFPVGAAIFLGKMIGATCWVWRDNQSRRQRPPHAVAGEMPPRGVANGC